MQTKPPLQHRAPPYRAALHDAAKLHAQALRQEAMDGWWSAVAGALGQGLQVGRRALARVARLSGRPSARAQLQRHDHAFNQPGKA